jgi:hypothetical protein
MTRMREIIHEKLSGDIIGAAMVVLNELRHRGDLHASSASSASSAASVSSVVLTSRRNLTTDCTDNTDAEMIQAKL